MTDERWHEQAAAYALGALDEAERAAFEARMAEDASLRAVVADYENALADVAAGLPGEGPPPALKRRVLERAREVRAPAPAAAEPTAPAPRRGGATPWILLAASVAGLVWLGLENRDLQGRADTLANELTSVRTALGGARTELARLDSLAELLAGDDVRFATLTGDAQPTMRLVWNAERRVLLVAASGLPAPAAGRVYQLWGLSGDQAPVSLGTFATGPDGTALVTLSPDASPDFDLSAITDEPEGGSPQPTTQPFLVGAWRSAQE